MPEPDDVGARPRASLALQVLAAATLIVLAVGLAVVLRSARLGNAILPAGPTPTPLATPSASAAPVEKPSATASPVVGSGAPYPLLPPSTLRMIDAGTGWAAGTGTDRILRTHDGGASWQDVTPRTARPGLWMPFFLDAEHAWVASSLQPGSGSPDFSVQVYRTADGGQSWQLAGEVPALEGWPGGLDFVDARSGWLFQRLGGAAGSDGVAFYGTVDGGATWTMLSQADPSGLPGRLPLRCSKAAPVFLTGSRGWEPGSCPAGGGPFFYVTPDGGRTWNDAPLALPAGSGGSCACEIDSLQFVGARDGVFELSIDSPEGTPQTLLYATHDAGASWQPGPSMPPQVFTPSFVDAQHGFALNGKTNGILATADGGRHWAARGTVPSSAVPMEIHFVNLSTGWALGSETVGQTILKTSDGGQTWTQQLSP